MRQLIVLALAATFASAAWAQAKEKTGNSAFDTLDKNTDQFLSREEVAAEKELAKRFNRFDANKDGKLNVDEYIKAMADNDKRVLNDSAITTKVKSALLAEKGVPSMSISVVTYEAMVQLSGFVDSEEVRDKAAKVAAGVSGVKQVQISLIVRK
jgi:Ca2+-binding EF-hand superfamily protein